MGELSSTRRARIRLALAVATAGVAVAVAANGPSGPGGSTIDLREVTERQMIAAMAADGHLHDHSDPTTKNLLSRASVRGDEAVDPTTAAQATAAEEYVERERALPDPELTTVPVRPARTAVPATRYAMADGCYTLQAPSGAYVTRAGTSVALAKVGRAEAAGFFFKATRLGGYLLHTADGELAWTGLANKPAIAPKPSRRADWTVQRTAAGFTFVAAGSALRAAGDRLAAGATPTAFRLHTTSGCAGYPEAQVNVSGRPHAGVTSYQEVRGYVDAHTHGMAFEFLGGMVHCGRPWHEYGAPYALEDCADHRLTNGKGALLEAALSGKASHDPVGWPTFKDWPAPESLTHEGTYWKWLERSWRGGQRMLVNLLVENNKLCQIYPLKRNSCDDMDSIRLQARRMYELQDYIDAQDGGPGRGFYRIVRDPFTARQVVNAGKMAVVMGIETSVPFGCTYKSVAGKDLPACKASDIDRQLDEMHDLGVRQMELVNKFDNALAGVAGDAGAVGVVVNAANFLETGTFWQMQHCDPADGESHDNPQVAAPNIGGEQQDALFGAIGKVFGNLLPAVPLYPPPAHCNARGLTDLGSHTVAGLAKRKMLFDPDHLSVKARLAAMDVVEDHDYPGVLSSHSWSTPDTYPRIYKAGGFITPYAGDSSGFVAKWRRHLGWADPRYYFGFGYGADINGLGAQGDPRGAGVSNPVTYPFRGLNGVTVSQQRAGERTWDLNVDGVAQYGLYPDWIEDLRLIAEEQEGDGAAIVDDMTRGVEAYLQMWERAVGIAPDSCRNPGLRKTVGKVASLVRPGMSTGRVMAAVGQPYRRLGRVFGVCAKTSGDPKVMVRIEFDRDGRVVRVRS